MIEQKSDNDHLKLQTIVNCQQFHEIDLVSNGEYKSKSFLESRKVDLFWKNITYSVKGTTRGSKLQILDGVSGEIESGKLAAIMGPSGAGKTTLLNILTGKYRKNVEGEVVFKDGDRNITDPQAMSCYITQDEHLLPYLTAKEALTFSAKLKMDPQTTSEERENKVQTIMSSLGILRCANTRISNLSGGEKRRVSIGTELTSNPPVLFLDEPTTGLDSKSAAQCIEILKNLVRAGRTVVCTIHQPSARLFSKFDKLYMLASGQCIFNGSVQTVLPFFAAHGFICPPYHNPADFVLEVATGRFGPSIDKLACAVSCDRKASMLDDQIPQIQNQVERAKHKENIYAVPFLRQLSILLHRTWIFILRDPLMTTFQLFNYGLVGLLIGMLFFKKGELADDIFTNGSFIFICMLFVCETCVVSNVMHFPLEREVFMQEHFNRWYSVPAYFLARTLSDIPHQIYRCVLFGSFAYWMTGQPAVIWRFVVFLFALVMSALVSEAYGIMFSAGLSKELVAFVGPSSAFPFFLLSGFFVPLNSIPVYMKWISDISFYRYSMEALILSIYGYGREKIPCQSFCFIRDPKEVLQYFSMADSNLYFVFAMMALLFVLFKFICFLVLLWKVRPR